MFAALSGFAAILGMELGRATVAVSEPRLPTGATGSAGFDDLFFPVLDGFSSAVKSLAAHFNRHRALLPVAAEGNCLF
jgi:hypothetical protein